MVRRAAAHALGALARAVGPAPLLAALGGALVHPSWRVREEGVNAHTAALLAHTGEQFDYPACVRALAAAASDEEPRVAAAALEAFALLHARLGALLQGMLTAVGADDGLKRRVAERARATPQLGLPALDSQGLVQHQVRSGRSVGAGSNRNKPAIAHPVCGTGHVSEAPPLLPSTCRPTPARPAHPSLQWQHLRPSFPLCSRCLQLPLRQLPCRLTHQHLRPRQRSCLPQPRHRGQWE